MRSADVVQALATVSAVLVQETDVTGAIAAALAEATRAVEADAGGLLVLGPGAGLELLAATSHRAADLETYQSAEDEGPCVECVRRQEPVTVPNLEDAEARWPAFGRRMREAGYARMYAAPMLWHGSAVGGLNLFWTEAAPHDDPLLADVAQVFADILSIAVVTIRPIDPAQTLAQIQEALQGRAVVEQAKGVVANDRGLDMEAAFAVLVELAGQRKASLGEVARSVIDGARLGHSLD